MTFGPKVKVGLALAAVLGLVVAWQGLSYWWHHGYSSGERTGVIRRMAVIGSPVCKYAEGELALTGSSVGQNVEIWKFSVDDQSENSPVMKKLREAERAGTRVTLRYRQDLKSWWRCTPHEYFVVDIEK
jgi:hypothetical protein